MDSELGTSSVRIEQLTDRNYASWSSEMVLLLEQRRVLSIVNEKEVLSASAAAGTSEAAMDKAAQFWQRHGVARSTILLGMTPGVQIRSLTSLLCLFSFSFSFSLAHISLG
jgi:hypothetical protein